MFKIRDVTIHPPLVLAPVAGYTDSLFRQAIKRLGGCGLVFSELVSTEGMTRNQKKTSFLTHFEETERPIAIQIFGSNPERMALAAAMIEEMGADLVDINLGCPVKKVVKQGGGSNLLRNLPLMGRILESVRKAIRIPLTVKIRSGWDRDSINALEVLRLAEDSGVDALTIHGRTRADLFSGSADWRVIGQVKEKARIPIIGNGDVFSPEDAERMFRETGVDGVMIGRGVMANPWLICQCWAYLSGGEPVQVSMKERLEFVIGFLQKIKRELPDPIALGKMKKIGGYLSKGLPGSGHLRAKIHASHTTSDLFAAIMEHFNLQVPPALRED